MMGLPAPAEWLGAFMGQLFVGMFLSFLLRKIGEDNADNTPLACVLTLAIYLTVSACTGNHGLAESIIVYVPTIFPVYLMLDRRNAKSGLGCRVV
jgi:hypothetical protein